VEYETLGNTGLLVSKLCFGTMTFGDGRGLFKALSVVGQTGADELIKTAIVGIRKGRPARMESACRRLAFRQIQPNEPEARGFAPH